MTNFADLADVTIVTPTRDRHAAVLVAFVHRDRLGDLERPPRSPAGTHRDRRQVRARPVAHRRRRPPGDRSLAGRHGIRRAPQPDRRRRARPAEAALEQAARIVRGDTE